MTPITVTRKADGLMLSVGPVIIGHLNFFEGIIYRLTGRLPYWAERVAQWYQTEPSGGAVHFNVRDES